MYPNSDKCEMSRDRILNEIIFCQKNAENNFYGTQGNRNLTQRTTKEVICVTDQLQPVSDWVRF